MVGAGVLWNGIVKAYRRSTLVTWLCGCGAAVVVQQLSNPLASVLLVYHGHTW